MNVLIVDDEPLARQRLSSLLQQIDGMALSGEAGNGRDALKIAQNLRPDVVLLDIRMPGMDGVETAHHLNNIAHPPAIIFTTAFTDHALKAFETHAVDYLLKPIKQERLVEALKAASRLTKPQLLKLREDETSNTTRSHICVKIRGNLELVPVEDICFFMADHKYVTLKTPTQEHLIEESLKSLEEEFADRFTRVHRNALVANSCMAGLGKNSDGHAVILLKDMDDQLEISRRHLPSVRKKLKTLSTLR